MRRGLAARNLLFATAVTGGLISLMLLKDNHENWMRSASGAAARPAIATTKRNPEVPATHSLTSQVAIQLIAGTTNDVTAAAKTTQVSGSAGPATKAVTDQLTPTTNRACQEALDRGKAFLAEGRAGNAIVLLRQAIAHDPKCAEAHYHLGLAYSMQGDVAAARAHRDVLKPLNPNLASLLGNLVR